MRISRLQRCLVVTVLATWFGTGCSTVSPTQPPAQCPDLNLPKELEKCSHPTYIVESPDILQINATRVIPLPPYKVEPLDQIFIVVQNTLALMEPDARINGVYAIDPDGTINLGPNYGGAVRVVDLSTQEIEKLLVRHLKSFFKEEVKVTVSLAQSHGSQVIRGEHLVRPDGTVSLGTYGKVFVAGMTLEQIKAAIETHLAKTLYKPEVDVDVLSYNSKFYYVITDFAGNGDQVTKSRLPGTRPSSTRSQTSVAFRSFRPRVSGWPVRPRRVLSTRSCRSTGRALPAAATPAPITNSSPATACSSCHNRSPSSTATSPATLLRSSG